MMTYKKLEILFSPIPNNYLRIKKNKLLKKLIIKFI